MEVQVVVFLNQADRGEFDRGLSSHSLNLLAAYIYDNSTILFLVSSDSLRILVTPLA